MKKYKVGLVGTGARCLCYAKAYAKSPEMEVAAMADPSPANMDMIVERSGLKGNIARHGDWRALYEKHPDLDGVVICVPNHLHREIAVPFYSRNIPVALEKPMTTTVEDGEAILEAERKFNGRTLIGFVLRSAPYFKKIKELVDADAIGPILSLQSDELAGPGVSSIIFRSPWRRYQKYSGGSMMEKSSHDLDLINWIVGGRPVAVNSFGGRTLFTPNPNLPKACPECALENCPYKNKPEFSPSAADDALYDFLRKDNHLCIYNVDKDIADNQSVSIQYSNGAVANFMLSFNCFGQRSGRNFHAVGSKGRIWGNIDDNELFLHQNSSGKTTSVGLGEVTPGHNGGDENHALELLRMMKDPAYRPAQDSYAGYLSSVMCIAADTSMSEGRRLHFRYDAHGRVAFS